MVKDLVIIGGGPAGAAAAVYAARKKLKTVLVAKEFGGQSVVSSEIYNWIGTKSVSGPDLATMLREHVFDYVGEGKTLDVLQGSEVKTVKKNDSGNFLVETDGQSFETKVVLVASGSSRKKLNISGASQFENKGVVYCASCDGPLFSGQSVAVIGGGNAGFETVAQLSAYCKSVTLLHHRDTYKADPITVEKVRQMPNVTLLTNVEPKEVQGEAFVSGLVYHEKSTGNNVTLPVTGIFVEVGQIPNTEFLNDLVKKSDYGNIVTDPRTGRSSCEGIWAAGDATDGLYHQNNIAAGQAVTAVEDLYLWLKTR